MGNSGVAINDSTPAQLRPDGAFTATGIAPGTYQLRVTMPASLSQVWILESAVSRGRDLLDVPLEIEAGGDLSGVILTFSDRRSELAGIPASIKVVLAPGARVTQDIRVVR